MKDVDNIMVMLYAVRKAMNDLGNFQWNPADNYPNPEIIKKDIEEDTFYVVEEEDQILACANITTNPDE